MCDSRKSCSQGELEKDIDRDVVDQINTYTPQIKQNSMQIGDGIEGLIAHSKCKGYTHAPLNLKAPLNTCKVATLTKQRNFLVEF